MIYVAALKQFIMANMADTVAEVEVEVESVSMFQHVQ